MKDRDGAESKRCDNKIMAGAGKALTGDNYILRRDIIL